MRNFAHTALFELFNLYRMPGLLPEESQRAAEIITKEIERHVRKTGQDSGPQLANIASALSYILEVTSQGLEKEFRVWVPAVCDFPRPSDSLYYKVSWRSGTGFYPAFDSFEIQYHRGRIPKVYFKKVWAEHSLEEVFENWLLPNWELWPNRYFEKLLLHVYCRRKGLTVPLPSAIDITSKITL